MNRSMLYAALLGLFCSSIYADDALKPVPVSSDTTIIVQTPKEPVKEVIVPTPAKAMVIDCQYRLPANTPVEQSILKTWVEKAAVQSFDFSPATLDDQLIKLKPCFTDQGWQSFNDALQKSGNMNTIKSHKLTVSSQVNGEIVLNPTKDNQWKAKIPMQVVYQNEKEKLTQLLSVDLLIGRKMSGDLGILQIIATPVTTPGTATPTAGVTRPLVAPSGPDIEAKPAPASE